MDPQFRHYVVEKKRRSVDVDLNEDRIRHYLLATLPEEEQERFEAEFFRDDALFEQVRAVEDDLIDEYVTGALSDNASRRFESHFLTSPARQRRVDLARALQETTAFQAVEAGREEPAALRRPVRTFWGFHQPRMRLVFMAASVFVVLSVILGWETTRYRRLERQVAEARASVDVLKKDNASLRELTAVLKNENQSANALVHERLAERDRLNALTGRGARQHVRVVLRDTSGIATLGNDDTVILATYGRLPAALSRSVGDFMTTGTVAPVEPARPIMEALRGDVTRSALRSGRGVTNLTPVPLGPLLTAIRSTRPTLHWKAIPGAQEYKVIVADRNDKVVWQSSAGEKTEVTLPPNVLQPGGVYFWQVEALVGAESRLSPTVGFWLLDGPMVRDVENAERTYASSALVLASIYAAHGLLGEALMQVERLAQLNPGSPTVQVMHNGLRRQLDQE